MSTERKGVGDGVGGGAKTGTGERRAPEPDKEGPPPDETPGSKGDGRAVKAGSDDEPPGGGLDGGKPAPDGDGGTPEVQGVGVGIPVGARKTPEPRGTAPPGAEGERPAVVLPATRGP